MEQVKKITVLITTRFAENSAFGEPTMSDEIPAPASCVQQQPTWAEHVGESEWARR